MSPAPQVSSLTQFGAYAPSGGLGVRYSLLDDNSLVLLLKAVMNESKGTVLEAPRLTCYNTQRANIQVLRNRNYVRRVSSDFTPEIGNIPEGTIFDIQPFVSADRRYITLVCQPQMRTFVSFTAFTYGIQTVQVSDTDTLDLTMTLQLPTSTLRSIGTTVTVPNGGTIVMGGFTVVEEGSGIASAPLLEGIPLLRYLFRGRDIIEGRRSLIMLITAETVEDIFEEEEG
jgi:general secretion pathway protein D